MGILGILHHGLTVSDLDRSVDWYCNVLGFEEVHRQTGDNDYTRALVGVDGAAIRVAQLSYPGRDRGWPSSHVIELIEYTKARGEQVRSTPNDVGAGHLALVVDNIDQLCARVIESGCFLRNPPVAVVEGVNKGSRACYLHDPDGHTLELMQYGAERAAQLRTA